MVSTGLLILVILSAQQYGDYYRSTAPENQSAISNQDASQSAPSPDSVSGDQSADTGNQQPEEQIPSPFSFPAPSFPALDLIEQGRMADFTEDVALYAKLALFLTAFGLALLVGTLIYTGVAASHTKNTLSIATDSLEETKIRNRIELRAYMTPTDRTIGIAQFTEKGKGPEFRLVAYWENIGSTPAMNVITAGTIKKIRPGEAIPEFDVSSASGAPAPTTIGKDKIINIPMFISPEDAIASFNGETILVLYSVIRYEDIYGTSYVGEITQVLELLFDPAKALEELKVQDNGLNWRSEGTQQGERPA